MSNYALADTKSQWFQDNYPGSSMRLSAATLVLVLHTTEGMTFPTYSGGATAPNYTGLPPIKTKRKGQWRAHFPDEKSSRALRNLSGGVETNTLDSIQVELVGTCDPKHRKSWNGQGRYLAGRDYVFWPDATPDQILWLARLIANLNERHGLKLDAPQPFKSYPESYGANGVRISHRNWAGTAGVIGHQHVPENVHGDPGNIAIMEILLQAKKLRGFVSNKKSRGQKIDDALENLKSAQGQGKRAQALKAAKKAVRKIPYIN